MNGLVLFLVLGNTWPHFIVILLFTLHSYSVSIDNHDFIDDCDAVGDHDPQ